MYCRATAALILLAAACRGLSRTLYSSGTITDGTSISGELKPASQASPNLIVVEEGGSDSQVGSKPWAVMISLSLQIGRGIEILTRNAFLMRAALPVWLSVSSVASAIVLDA